MIETLLEYKIDSVSVSKIKVLLLQIYYPLSMGRYFDRALRRRDDVDLITCGPYTGSWIPWLGGMNVAEKYALPPDIPLPLPPNVGQVNYELVKANLPANWIPDIVLTVDAGIHWRYKPNEGYVAHVATDPHALNYDYQRTISDKFFNMQLCYSKPDDIYLPYAYDPTVHYPMDNTYRYRNYMSDPTIIEKDTDAVLIGMPYEQRVQWVNALRSRGVSVIFENGPIFDEYRIQNNRARIGLNWSSLNDLNARAFEIPAMKLYPVINNVPDWWKHESLHHHHIFNNLGEAVDAVLWARDNPEKARENAEVAYELVQGETYDARVSQILKECKFL